MLDLDKYINNSLKIKVFGEEYDVLEPTLEMLMKTARIEADMTQENKYEKQLQTAELLLNHNKQGKEFGKEELKKLPYEALVRLIVEIAILRLKAETDPNLKSQSQTEK